MHSATRRLISRFFIGGPSLSLGRKWSSGKNGCSYFLKYTPRGILSPFFKKIEKKNELQNSPFSGHRGGWHAPHCLPENVPYPAFAPGLNRKNAPPHRKRWSGAVFMRFCQPWKGAGAPAFRKRQQLPELPGRAALPQFLPAWAGNTSRTAPCRCGSPATR